MTGGELLIQALVQLLLTAVPAVAAAMVAIRLGVRKEVVLLAVALAVSGVLAMLTFWIYLYVPVAGSPFAYAVFFAAAGLIVWLWRDLAGDRDLLRRLSVPLALWALGSLFVIFFGFLHGGSEAALSTASSRFSTQPSQFASDSYIPLFFSEWIFGGAHGAPPLFLPDWLFSDRPPLQIGYVLTQRVFGWDTATLHYELLGVMLQQLWIVGMWALLKATGVSARTRALVMVASLLSDIAIVDSFYVWPKLLGAAFALAAFALVAGRRESTLKAEPWTLLPFGALCGLAYLSHGTSTFAVIPMIGIAIWRGLPGWRMLAAGAAMLVVLVAPWSAYQHWGDPPGDRLLKWYVAGVVEIEPRGVVQATVDEYRKAGIGGTLENKLDNFLHMAGGNPKLGKSKPGEMPQGNVVEGLHDAASDVVHGHFGAADSQLREIKYWHEFWTVGLLMLAVPLILLGRLTGRWRDEEDWWLGKLCLIFFVVGAVSWGLLMFGNIPARTVVEDGPLALPLVAMAGLVAGLRATFPRWANWLVGLNALTVLVIYVPTLAETGKGSVSGFALIAAALSLAGFAALVFRWAPASVVRWWRDGAPSG
jgi:hypothetical protein